MATTNPTQNIHQSAFRSMLEIEKLSGPNFNDWYRQVRINLRAEKKYQVLEEQRPVAPGPNASNEELADYAAAYDKYNEVACLMLGSMNVDLQKKFKHSFPCDMLTELKFLCEKQAGVELFDLVDQFHDLRHEQGTPVSPHILKMKRYFEQLERLNYAYPQPITISMILKSLIKDFEDFVRNYTMHSMNKTIAELHAMANEYEKKLPKKSATPQVLTIKGEGSKNRINRRERARLMGLRRRKKLKPGSLQLFVENGLQQL
uniref:uncharacterized protein LOC122601148 n=1 Tax=Erigeron canadensis TaxID=72917 RepID=UPI001CB8E7FF|nr:uncharacterized protein LOC122601148 [Erigeron canadensis]